MYTAVERLRLAVLILHDIPPQSVVDDSESWTEEDLQDFTQGSWKHIDQRLEDEEYACPYTTHRNRASAATRVWPAPRLASRRP
ncbi:MAG TPA: hypothetical protein VI542_23830 [Candidatus Tectomicrobia bacterium]